ncbi:flagellar biosynthetic protein FliR [Caulobacter sp. DWR1-3-2b1]|uniref:flagellar biosynthetic protein FliR n=1 Tax=Caulobacter sp. DWR1-3-2b1 TaxID=2804670 RepID=UPI003CE94502
MLAVLLLSLRVTPVFALAPPFTLTRTPTLFRVVFGMGLSATLVSAYPATREVADLVLSGLVAAAARELVLGAMVVLTFQMMFAALYVAGRTLDIQAGFGLSLLIDPTTQTQAPLAGTLFAYAAGAVFFAMDGHIELLRLLGASLEAIPLGSAATLPSLGRMAAFISAVFATAMGVAGGAILCLFLADLAIALLSRTTPQLNVLVLGFQVKTLLLFLVLPGAFGMAGALFVRLSRITLEALPGLL